MRQLLPVDDHEAAASVIASSSSHRNNIGAALQPCEATVGRHRWRHPRPVGESKIRLSHVGMCEVQGTPRHSIAPNAGGWRTML